MSHAAGFAGHGGGDRRGPMARHLRVMRYTTFVTSPIT
jgi:hypothetical protein